MQWHQLDHSKQSAPRSRQITTQTHQSIFYRQDALPDAQHTVSEHWKDVHIVETAARTRTKTRLINMQPKNTTLLCRGNNYAHRESPTCRVVGETTSWDAGLNGGAEYFSWEWIGCTGNAAGRLYVGREYGCPDNGWYVPCQPHHSIVGEGFRVVAPPCPRRQHTSTGLAAAAAAATTTTPI